MKRRDFKTLITILLAALLVCICPLSIAETIDLSALTYDELVTLRTQADTLIKEFERQYAIENGNRVITLNQESVTLFPKQTSTLVPEVRRIVEDAPETTTFVWTSSNEAVATVSSKGIITAVAEGEAVITCSAADDEYIFTNIPVSIVSRVSSVALSEAALTLHLSESDPSAANYLLALTIEPSNAYYQTVTWSSSNESVAVVDGDGYIQAFTSGTATVTATSDEPVSGQQQPKKAVVKLTVVQDVNSISLNESSLRIKKGSTATLKAAILPENATAKKVSWESSDSSIASITSAGQITAKANGTCTITCKATDGSDVVATCEVTVFQPVTSIKAEKSSIKAFIGSEPTQIAVTVSPESATDKTLTWTSSDESIATVDENGNVTAVAGGSCKIICTANDGTNKTTEISVLVPSISVEKTDYTVTEKSGLTIPLKYFGQDISKLKLSAVNSTFFTAKLEKSNSPAIIITPERAGKTTITLNDSSNEKNAVKLSIEVASSAVYDSTSYPKANYTNILRYPEEHKGKQYQIYGKVLQKIAYGNYVDLRVGTSGGFYDSVFYISYSTKDLDVRVIEDDYITVYGTCTGDYTYETVMGNEITIPSMDAEKIKIGRK